MSENFSKAEMVKRIAEGWNQFNNYLKTLSEDQLTTLTDAAGWTVKDHVMHLVVWEDGIVALLNRESRLGRMGLDAETWASRDFDRMNGVIFQQHKSKSWPEVKQAFEDVHRRLLDKLQTMSEDDLSRPHKEYQPDSDSDDPIWRWLPGDTFEHYAEHRPWIETIVTKGK